MKGKLKAAALLATTLVLAFALAGCGGSQSSSSASASSEAASSSASASASGDSVGARIGTQDLLGGAAITKGAGYFEEAMGAGTTIQRFDAGRDINTALASGSVDFGMFGVVPTVVGLTSGTDMKVVYIECLIRGTEGLVVRESAGIKSVEDLKGKKVAVTVASSGHYGLLCALEDAGMTVDDIEMVDMDPKSTYAAWQRGDIDAAYTWNPTLINIAHDGGTVILTVADLVKNGHQTINFHVVSSKFAEEHPDQVKAYCEALAKGVDLYNSDKDKAFDIVCDYLEIDRADAEEQMSDKYVPLDEQLGDEAFGSDTAANVMMQVAQFLKDAGQIQDAKDLQFYKDAIDTSYIEALVEEGK